VNICICQQHIHFSFFFQIVLKACTVKVRRRVEYISFKLEILTFHQHKALWSAYAICNIILVNASY
jgi:hypothetical protein